MRVDLATSITAHYQIMPGLASVTRFNTSPFAAWRAGFRECVKLSGQAISRPSPETEVRLQAWCDRGQERAFGDLCINGARAGRAYGKRFAENTEALRLINDFSWLRQVFERRPLEQQAAAL